MSFTSHELCGDAPQASYDVWKYIGEYKVRYRLFTDDEEDGAQVAIAYVESAIAGIGDTYAYGNDARGTAYLRTIEAVRDPGSTLIWFATLTYRDEEIDEEQIDESGNPTDNPTDMRPELEVQTVQYSRPVEKALYLGGFTGIAHTKLTGDELKPVVNSALAVYNPPPEIDHHRWTLRVKRNVVSINCDTVKNNVVNNAAITFQYRGVKKTIPQYCGKTRDFRASPRHHHAYGDYVEIELWIDVIDDGDRTWRPKYLDAGFAARAMLGDPDGHGGAIYEDSRAFIEELAPQRRLTDSEQIPLSEPVPLNGDGQPLLTFRDDTGELTVKYGEWKVYLTESDYKTWGIFNGMHT